MKAPIFVVLAFLVNSALTGVSLSPGLQRKNLGGNCTFQWTVTGTIKDFVIYMNGTSVAQNLRVSLQRDSNGNSISMTITSIAVADAGNYTLSINNGVAWENDSSALLFVFVSGSNSLSQTLGSNPSTEGDSVELTCTFTSNSQPVAYRPGVVYSWYLSRFGTLQVLSNGSLQFTNGDIVSGYITRNNGRTLTVSSVQYIDGAQSVYCYVKEDGTTLLSSAYFYLNVQYKPVVTATNPPSRKYNALVGERVQLFVYQRAYPNLQAPGNNWTFVSSRGNVLDIPEGSVVGIYASPSLSFNLSSDEYYGKYSYSMSNTIGTTVITFEVLYPGKPDPPAAFQVIYASHFSIGLQWNCMWSNFNSRNQYAYTELREPKSNVILLNILSSLGIGCYNSTTTVYFNSKIQPDTYYEASVFSDNEIGRSNITTISVRSAKVLRFIVSSDSIQLNGTTAIINYRIESGNVAYFYVTCCYELTIQCVNSVNFYVNNNIGQVNFSFGSLPNSTEYVFDFYLYVGPVSNPSLVGLVKGIRASRAMGNTTPDVPTSDLAPAVIALAIVLGIAVLAIIGMLIGFLIWKRRHYSPTSNSQELQPNRSGTNQSEAEDYYEEMDRQTSENRVYANLDDAKRI